MVIYNDTDITEKTDVISADHEMNAGGCADTLEIRFDDSDHLWSRWGPSVGDSISFKDGGTSTGKMYVYDFSIEDDVAVIYASSIPPYLRNTYSKTWEEVYLSQILKEVTPSFQLNAIEDVWYRYKDCNRKLISFLNETAELEGAALILHDDTVILVNEQALEAQDANVDVDCAGANVKIKDDTAELFDACIVKSGQYQGSFAASEGDRVYKPGRVIPCGSDAEAFRYAKSLLRAANRTKTDIRWRGNIMPHLSAGTCINLINSDNPSWSGKMYCYRVRHEYGKNVTTIYMRRPLEGY